MDDFEARLIAGQDERRDDRARAAARRRAIAERRMESFEARPDRIALWAFLMALAVTFAAAASSQAASSGGIDSPDPDAPETSEMDRSLATWYGPGFWGNKTACGQTLRRTTVGVAHRRLPCGTKVTIAYKGNQITTEVIDRGPYANDANWDLTQAAAREVGFTATDDIRTFVHRDRR